jgi:APA family basic amino acid/polyamine antiporter
VILATIIAALLAACNALSSAQLAAAHPVAGGTYAYGYRYLRPSLGFTAGWMFLWAKSASAATAALGFSGYFLNAVNASGAGSLRAVSLGTVALVTLIVLGGIRQSNMANVVIVSITLVALVAFIAAGIPVVLESGTERFNPFLRDAPQSVFHASALMFVAFAGYARITTLGEEVHEPSRTIPRAIILALAASAVLYVAVASVGIGAVGADAMEAASHESAATLEVVARQFEPPWIRWVVATGAMTAMLGVLLNLLLGLSRVLFAMGRGGDMPSATAALSKVQTTPYVAVLTVGIVTAALAAIGNVRTTWSFSAFTVLIYYAITNLAALCLPKEERRYSRWFARVGLAACLFLAFWVDRHIWALGLGLIAAGLTWHRVARLNDRQRRLRRTLP